MPVAWIASASVSRQLSFEMAAKAPGPWTSRIGSASALETLKEGPIPRMRSCFGTLPVTIKPLMPTPLPVSTRILVERLTVLGFGPRLGVAVGVAVALGVVDGTAVAVALGVA